MTARSPSYDDVNGAALAAYPGLLHSWLPNGRLHGYEFRVGNLQGEAGESLSVNTRTGVWRDFASDDGGSDSVSLYAAINSLQQGKAKTRLAEELGLATGQNGARSRRQISAPKKSETDSERRAAALAIWETSGPAIHTPAHAYLQGRGIVNEPPACLRYHARSHALVALVQAPDGGFSGIQRIYLTTDHRGTWRADRDKQSRGIIKGGAVRLTPAAESLQLTESVEDGMALLQMTGRATWAVPGAGFMVNFEPPDEVKEVILAPDNDAAGLEAIEKARSRFSNDLSAKTARLAESSLKALKLRQLLPPPGMDWCNVLEDFDERSAIQEEPAPACAASRSWVEEFCDGE
jgi:hypothetical protein